MTSSADDSDGHAPSVEAEPPSGRKLQSGLQSSTSLHPPEANQQYRPASLQSTEESLQQPPSGHQLPSAPCAVNQPLNGLETSDSPQLSSPTYQKQSQDGLESLDSHQLQPASLHLPSVSHALESDIPQPFTTNQSVPVSHQTHPILPSTSQEQSQDSSHVSAYHQSSANHPESSNFQPSSETLTSTQQPSLNDQKHQSSTPEPSTRQKKPSVTFQLPPRTHEPPGVHEPSPASQHPPSDSQSGNLKSSPAARQLSTAAHLEIPPSSFQPPPCCRQPSTPYPQPQEQPEQQEQPQPPTSSLPQTNIHDLLHSEVQTKSKKDRRKTSGPQKRLEKLLSQSCNKHCADCGSTDPKWVSISHGVFICIKCSGIHRSLGVHISKVLSVKLDEWTDDQVTAFMEMGGNIVVNKKLEAFIPEDCRKPKSDAAIDERAEYIRLISFVIVRRKYEMQEFTDFNDQMVCPHNPNRTGDKRHYEKQTTRHRIGSALRNSWGRKEAEQKQTKKSISLAGMVEFVGLIKVNVVKGTNLAIRDMVTSDPYVILALGHQSVKTRVIKNNLNPVWNESLMLSIPDHIPPLKLLVYDKDTFSTDDFMGEAEIDIEPLVSAARAYETSSIDESTQLGKWVASKDNTLVKDGIISLIDGKVKQEISLRLQNVERGVLEIELECVPLTQ
ncbi:Probable ADP-ribosylation factor GTPase-activating protein AGD11 [Linum perenne]